ncbi:hypothetical protein ACN6LF_002038 [[Kitasatospora] papulosa]|uniref:hypothetical protein n=1 Tax=Streptomyces TaxID=1883 RepID=UPI0002C6C136|nr:MULTISPECIES: hypothetical protein [unclassified Streptomyces]MBD2834296.1 hypothetical protein [Streptomyces pratensis]AGJ52694.1 hypothetical protein F750_0183 [Streptomyces sp. PAMC 26508]AGJ57881.1 hypothetical protein F750_5452 [Streptomyces sp. PAMC 26508]MBD2835231.1 hypothetical protein [Streptomyces pratensis]WKV77459.1 hypothetical protein HBB06_04570 [Streptomyces sp. SNU607]
MNPSLPLYIADLLTKTPKIKVIKELRSLTGFSLETAKGFCDAVEGRRFLREQVQPEFGGGSLASRIRLLQSDEGHLEAVRLVQDETGVTTAEARRFIASLDATID